MDDGDAVAPVRRPFGGTRGRRRENPLFFSRAMRYSPAQPVPFGTPPFNPSIPP